VARGTAAAYENARLELLAGLGHSPQLEDPPRFGAILQDFLGGTT
jgi:pimeloyl-ACP methyl ester carboxylesterase